MFLLPFFGFLPCVSAGVDPRDIREQAEMVRRAAGLDSMEKLAFALGIDEAQLHRQLQGEGHFSWTRVVATVGRDPKFWQNYLMLLGEQYGISEEAARKASMVIGLASVIRRNAPLKMAAVESAQRREA